jgi:plasmid stabilization system protein ParE
MKCAVEVTDTAEAELDAAYRWLRDEYSPAYAARWREGLLDAAGTLETLPERCPLAPEARTFRRRIRQLVYGKRHGAYRILFEIRDRTVFVLHIRHGARRQLNLAASSEDDE